MMISYMYNFLFFQRDLSVNTNCADLHENYHGLSIQQQTEKRVVYGPNTINVEVKSYGRLFIEEVIGATHFFIINLFFWKKV